jgi:glucose/arabinose dehydrogenase/cytochrome c2
VQTLTALALLGLFTGQAVAAGAASAGDGSDVGAGRLLFRQQCAICHSAEPRDDGGAQGPNLAGIVGRPAASAPGFGYTAELRASGLRWDAATLERFLRAPTALVPGTSMAVAVPSQADREHLVAYLQAESLAAAARPVVPMLAPGPATPGAAAAASDAGNWRNDAPGHVHRIAVDALPAPFASPSSARAPRTVDRPAGAQLHVPAGFKVEAFASNLHGPRTLRVAPNGDVLVVESRKGRVLVLRPTADGAHAASVQVYADDLSLPFGIAFYPDAHAPQWLYVAEVNRVLRYRYRVGDLQAQARPEVVIPQLSPVGTGGHVTRDLVFSPDGRKLFVSVGSASNVAESMSKKEPAEIKAWESAHGPGSTWGSEEKRAVVLAFDVQPGGTVDAGRVYASGIRNCVALVIEPASGEPWCTTNERDGLGDDLVPDYSTRVREGGYYGWPWYYLGNHEDPRLKGERPDLAGRAIVPDLAYQAHSAPLGFVFYEARTGTAAFPGTYLGDGFAALHGSWNRATRTGSKVVRVRMDHGVATGEYEDFLTGFVVDDDRVWGRPVSLAVGNDGALLASDDAGDVIWRITPSAAGAAGP